LFSFLFIALGASLFSGCVAWKPEYNPSSCSELAKKLDAVIFDTQNPPGRFTVQERDGWGFVGGTLTGIENLGVDQSRGYYNYVLKFKGLEKEGELFLITKNSASFPYKIGKFYSFNLQKLTDIKYSAALGGSFTDGGFNELRLVDCNSTP